jgi:uncharacterized protein YkwD
LPTRTVTFDRLKGWNVPKTDLIKFDGKLPIKNSAGKPVKGRAGDGVIYYLNIFAGQRALKAGQKWRIDTRYPDSHVGSYTFLIEKMDDGMGVRSYVGQQGRFQKHEFVLIDVNSNGRFDDAGKDLLLFKNKKTFKVGDQVVLGTDKLSVKIPASGRTVTFGKAMSYAEALTGGDGDADAALAAWNQIRASLHVPPVRRDPKIESWGYKHIEYMKAVGKLVHPENKKHPKYTPEGHKAGMQSDLSAGQRSAKASVLSLMNTFFHRVALIRPEVEVVGISYDPASKFAVVNYGSGPKRKGAKWPGPLAYPPDGATGVPPGWSGREGPSPIPSAPPSGGVSQTVTLTFPRTQRPKGAKVTVTESGGGTVNGWVSTPEKPAARMFRDNMNTVCFIGKAPFKSNTTYRVKVEATVRGKPFVKEWQFTTGQGRRRGRGGGRRRRR